jgi:VCBS repeat-containing protein
VTTVIATDVDGPATTYSISGGADAGLFSINPTSGVLSFNAAPNFEIPADAGSNNVYDVIVQVSDGSLTDTQQIAVTVTNVNEAPLITSNGGSVVGLTAVLENTTSVTAVTAADADLPVQTLGYSIAGGDHASLFRIDSTTGALAFLIPPNYESPTDASGLGIYNVIVLVDDGAGGSDAQHLYVRVADANDAPMASPDSASGPSSVAFAGNLLGNDTDEDGNPLAAYLVSGPASGTLTLQPDGSFSYTSSALFSGSDSFTYRASDGINDSAATTVTLTVLPVFVPPLPPPSPPSTPSTPSTPEPANAALPLAAVVPVLSPSAPFLFATAPLVTPAAAPPQPQAAFLPNSHVPPAAVPTNMAFAPGNSILVDVRYDFDLRQLIDLLRGSQAASDAAPVLKIGSQPGGLAEDALHNTLRIEASQIPAVFLSAGVVIWGLRAGGLLASLLATLPAWRSFDLLPVIRDDRDESGEAPAAGLGAGPGSKHIQELETET